MPPFAQMLALFDKNKDGRISREEIAATPQMIEGEILAVNNLDEECVATPAITDGRLYLRTRNALYCFGATNTADRPEAIRVDSRSFVDYCSGGSRPANPRSVSCSLSLKRFLKSSLSSRRLRFSGDASRSWRNSRRISWRRSGAC